MHPSTIIDIRLPVNPASDARAPYGILPARFSEAYSPRNDTSSLASVLPKVLKELSGAVKAIGFYPSDHPTVASAVERAAETVREAIAREGVLRVGVGDAVFLHGTERIGVGDRVLASFATYLGRRGVGVLTFKPPVGAGTLKGLLEVIALDPGVLRSRGGPARCLAERRLEGVSVEEFDTADVLRAARTTSVSDSGRESSPATSLNDLVARFLTGQDGTPSPEAKEHLERAVTDPGAARALLKAVQGLASREGAGSGRMMSLALARMAAAVAGRDPAALASLASSLRAALDDLDPATRMEVLQSSIPVAGTDLDLAREIRAGIPDDRLGEMIVSLVRSEGKLTPRLTSVIRKVLIDTRGPGRDRGGVKEEIEAARRKGSDPLADVWASIEDLLEESEDDWLSREYKNLLEIVGAAGPALHGDLRREIRGLPEFQDALTEAGDSRSAWLIFSEMLQVETEPAVLCEVLGEIERRAAGIDPGWYAVAGEVSSTVRDRLGSWSLPDVQNAGTATLRRIAGSLIGTLPASFHRLTEADRDALERTAKTLGAFVADPLLAALEKEEDWEIRKTLIRFLVAQGREVIPTLVKRLADPSWFLVRNILVVLGEVGDPSVLPMISGTLRHPEPRVRKEAVTALGKIGGIRAFGLVSEALEDPEVAEVAIRALGAINHGRAVAIFLQRAGSIHVLGRRNKAIRDAINALGELRAREAVPRLRSILARGFWLPPASGDPLRIAAAHALDRIGTPEALQAVTRGARLGRRPVRETCAAILERRERHA